MRDLLDEDGENRAVRTFLQLVYGGTTGSVTTDRMRDHLECSGWEDHTPEWAKKNQTLTKEGVQLWLRFLFSLEPKPPFVVGQKVDLKSPAVWNCSEENRRNGFTVTACEVDEKLSSGFRLQVLPSVIPCISSNDQAWCDAGHFIEKQYPVIQKGNWPVVPAKFVQHQTLLHVKTNKHICVILTPDRCRLEETEEPAYAYGVWQVSVSGEVTEGKEIWVRSQTEMEDGRFVLPDQSAQDVGNGIGPQTQAAIDSLQSETYLPKGNVSFVDEQAALNEAPCAVSTTCGGEE